MSQIILIENTLKKLQLNFEDEKKSLLQQGYILINEIKDPGTKTKITVFRTSTALIV